MTAKTIDGKAIAAGIKAELKKKVERLAARGIRPGIAVVLVGSYPPSQLYVKMKERDAQEIGINSRTICLPEQTSQQELLRVIGELNQDPKIDGILVQLPLPSHLNDKAVIEIINPKKDVDCFHPYNVGRLLVGETVMQPCTPLGCIALLEDCGIDIEGKKAVVVGRSNIVGKPLAVMLMQRNATVTICHSRTRDLPGELRQADIVVAAAGRPELIRGEHLKAGCTVIDVGQNRLPDGRFVGDVHFQSASQVAEWITPVPGGVGPMTRVMLLRNTVEAARHARGG
ncbi:MAG: bifunctional methylenetetrahydrofolate dehydrogenase/methenyltetrahydrofolate cyclohydrolase FolD [Syntrophomonadaceae bacterium]|nr:bifunctional methylenetetrahydrofolate dehydrogenase/methenyltetrahydrofolate cyclohydrolase FolD [Syntrophomonadaceae bacterium]